MKPSSPRIEIMSPVGNYETLMAAIKAGASSVYFGAGELNMRSHSTMNFTIRDLQKIANICRKNNVKSYLCVNAVLYDKEIEQMKKICNAAKKAKISAIIASDISAIQYAHSINLEVHISTQLNVSNLESVKFYSKFADVIVLARELELKQINYICDQIKKQKIKGPSGNLVKIELFVHGALCVSISGKCYMSLATYNKSANRGKCLQNCRRSYKVIDEETGDELRIENKNIMSPKDLCTITVLDKILASGVSILKIEGRARPPEYVYTTTKIYKEAVDSIQNKTYNKEKIQGWLKQLESVFNRGFWHGGYYLGNKLGEWTESYGSRSTKQKERIGFVKHYFPKAKVGEFVIQSGEITLGDEIIIIGKTTGLVQAKVSSILMSKNNQQVKSAKKGDTITIPIAELIRENDDLYVLSERKKLQINNKIK